MSNGLNEHMRAAAFEAGLILVYPLHPVFVEGKTGWQKGRPKLINVQHIIEIDIGKRECLITLSSLACLTVNRDELFAVLGIEQCD
jgi:hypothetical protein